MIKEKLLKERVKLLKLKETFEDKLKEIENDINEIDEFINFKSTDVSNDDIEPIEQVVMICVYPETADNAPQMNNTLWYPIYQNPNTTTDLTELNKTNKMVVVDDSKNDMDKDILSKLANHYNIELIGK